MRDSGVVSVDHVVAHSTILSVLLRRVFVPTFHSLVWVGRTFPSCSATRQRPVGVSPEVESSLNSLYIVFSFIHLCGGIKGRSHSAHKDFCPTESVRTLREGSDEVSR